MHAKIYPGSKCNVIFKSGYNPVARDSGKIRSVITPSSSKFNDHFSLHVNLIYGAHQS